MFAYNKVTDVGLERMHGAPQITVVSILRWDGCGPNNLLHGH